MTVPTFVRSSLVPMLAYCGITLFAQAVPDSPCVFAGSGLNDAVCGVGYDSTASFTVKISSAGTPDRFQWSKNGSAPSSPVPITGTLQLLSNGATIRFASTTGHTPGASWTISAAPNSTSADRKSIQPGIGAIFRSQSDINRDWGADVKDFGAKCDGVTDDTPAIQLALDAAPGNGRLTISGPQPCVISRTVYIPATDDGMILESTRVSEGIGLIAKQGAPAFQMLRVYAAQVHVRDLYLNCNSTASSGLVIADARQSVFDNIHSVRCRGDAIQIDPFSTPSTTLTSALAGGASSGTTFTVASATLDGVVLGGPNCAVVIVDYGKPDADAIQIGRSGNTLTIEGPAKPRHNHTSGSSIQCYGSNNAVVLNSIKAFYAGGWGLSIVGGSDNNAITIRDPTMFANKAGGELLSGSGGRHIGGHIEGNSGPAIQLGDLQGGLPGGRATYGWVIDPVNDLENSSPAYNAVMSVCDFRSSIGFREPTQLLFNIGGPYCHSLPVGNSTIGTGLSVDGNGNPRFTVKTASGMIVTQPGVGFSYFDAAGALQNTFGPHNASISGQITLGHNLQMEGNQLNLQKDSPSGEISLNRTGKPDIPVTLYNGAATPEVVLSPTGASSFIGIRARNLAGQGGRPACIDASGSIYAGTNANGVLTCP